MADRIRANHSYTLIQYKKENYVQDKQNILLSLGTLGARVAGAGMLQLLCGKVCGHSIHPV
jgi:hypothetical protein